MSPPRRPRHTTEGARLRSRPIAWLLYSLAALLGGYALVVAAFAVAGRRNDARALAGFVPDCVVLFSRLVREPAVPRRTKLLVAALIPYLALPFDLIPDFIPVAGQLDDAVLVALVLRRVVRSTEPEVLRRLWPGPASSLTVVVRLAGSGSNAAATKS